MASNETSPTEVLRTPAVCRWLGVSPATLRRWESEGAFPKRKQLGPRAVGWSRDEIERWLAARTVSP